MNLPYFKQKHLAVIYEIGEDHLQQIEQEKKFEHWQLVAENNNKLEAIVELLETIIVFNHGDGLRNFNGKFRNKLSTKERFLSFKDLCKGK